MSTTLLYCFRRHLCLPWSVPFFRFRVRLRLPLLSLVFLVLFTESALAGLFRRDSRSHLSSPTFVHARFAFLSHLISVLVLRLFVCAALNFFAWCSRLQYSVGPGFEKLEIFLSELFFPASRFPNHLPSDSFFVSLLNVSEQPRSTTHRPSEPGVRVGALQWATKGAWCQEWIPRTWRRFSRRGYGITTSAVPHSESTRHLRIFQLPRHRPC